MKEEFEHSLLVTSRLANMIRAEDQESQKRIVTKLLGHMKDFQQKVPPDMVGMAESLWHIDNSLEKCVSHSTCSKGCNHCCYLHLDVTDQEAKILMLWVQSNGIELPLERLKKQASVTYEDYLSLPLEERRCVFLDKEGCCSVYSIRPAKCRTQLAAGEPELCNTAAHPCATQKYVVSYMAEMVCSGINQVFGDLDSLPIKLLKFHGINIRKEYHDEVQRFEGFVSSIFG